MNADNTSLTDNASIPDRFALDNLGYVVHIDPARDPEGWYWTQTRDGQAAVVSSSTYFETKELAWANAEADALANYSDAWFKPYYLTRFQVDVVSETKEVTTWDLETIALEIATGECSGTFKTTGHWRLSASEAASKLESQGSSSDFFIGLDEVEERSSFIPPSPERAFAQGVRALLRKIVKPANAGESLLLNPAEVEQLLKEADTILAPGR